MIDFLQSPADNAWCSHSFIFLAWCIPVQTIAISFCKDYLTLCGYCHDLPPHVREIKALGHEIGGRPTTLCQIPCQTFTLGETLTVMGKKQFLQSFNSKQFLLICTVLVVLDPLDQLASVKTARTSGSWAQLQSSLPHSCRLWGMAFNCLAALLLIHLCKGHLHQVVLVLIFSHLIHKNSTLKSDDDDDERRQWKGALSV